MESMKEKEENWKKLVDVIAKNFCLCSQKARIPEASSSHWS